MTHPTHPVDATSDQPISAVVQRQSVQAMAAELGLRTDGVIAAVSSLLKAQQITQESLQLEVRV